MFCTSLRRRKSYSGILNTLTLPTSLGLRENELRTHDIILPLAPISHTGTSRQLRILLLSPSCIGNVTLQPTIQRIQHFASLTGGQDLAIVFLLYPGDEVESEEVARAGMLAYAKIQAELMNHADIPNIPILPLPKLEGLPDLLKKHHAARSTPQPPKQTVTPTAQIDLLSQCSANPPMQEKTAFLISDTFPNMRALAEACVSVVSAPNSSSPSTRASQMYDLGESGTQYSQGPVEDETPQSKLRQIRRLVGDAQVADVVDFWKEEYAL